MMRGVRLVREDDGWSYRAFMVTNSKELLYLWLVFGHFWDQKCSNPNHKWRHSVFNFDCGFGWWVDNMIMISFFSENSNNKWAVRKKPVVKA